MEAAVAMFATSGAAGAAGGGAAAAGGAAAGGGLLSSAAGAFSLFSGIFSVAQGVMQFAGGMQASAAMKSEAKYADFEAQQELLKGRQAALEEQEELNRTLASNLVAGFASGLRPSGSVSAASRQAIEDADFRTDLSRTNAAMKAGARRGEASRLRDDADAAIVEGAAKAAGTLVGAGAALSRRG